MRSQNICYNSGILWPPLDSGRKILSKTSTSGALRSKLGIFQAKRKDTRACCFLEDCKSHGSLKKRQSHLQFACSMLVHLLVKNDEKLSGLKTSKWFRKSPCSFLYSGQQWGEYIVVTLFVKNAASFRDLKKSDSGDTWKSYYIWFRLKDLKLS